MKDNARDEMRARFNNSMDDADDAHDTGDANDADGPKDTSSADGAGGTKAASSTKDAGDTGGADDERDDDVTRKRKQYPMYLPKELHDDLNGLYMKYDGKSKMSGGDGVEKHKQFLESVVRAGLRNPDLDELVGVELKEDER